MDQNIRCPYCAQKVEVPLEADEQGQMVLDCDVCCQPILLEVSWEGERARIRASRAQ